MDNSEELNATMENLISEMTILNKNLIALQSAVGNLRNEMERSREEEEEVEPEMKVEFIEDKD